MNSKELNEALNSLQYPGLGRTIGELKLLGSAKVENGRAFVELLTVSDESYLTLKKAIEETFGNEFDAIEVAKKALAKKRYELRPFGQAK